MIVRQKNIIFDLWGTLVHTIGDIDYRREIINLTGLKDEEFFNLIETLWFKERINAENGIKLLIEKVRLDKSIQKELLRLMHMQAESVAPYDDVFSSLKRLSKGHIFYLATDCGPITRKAIENSGIAPFFRQLFLSNEEGLTKKEGLYNKIFSATGIHPSESMVVGDSIRRDYLIARQAGMSSLLLDREGIRGEYDKIRTLEELE